MIERICESCGNTFIAKSNAFKFCPACSRERMLEAKRRDDKKRREERKKSRHAEIRLEPGGDMIGRGITHTLEETARHFGVTRQAIQQIEKTAIMKLKRELKKRGINSLGDLF